MAYYLVTAKPKDGLEKLRGNLQRRAYVAMRPFGKAMTHALENARLRRNGYAAW